MKMTIHLIVEDAIYILARKKNDWHELYKKMLINNGHIAVN